MSSLNEVHKYMNELLEKFAQNVAESLNQYSNYMIKRLDKIEVTVNSIDARVRAIESNLESVKGNIKNVKQTTDIIPDIFSMLHGDGKEIAKLNVRIDKLEN